LLEIGLTGGIGSGKSTAAAAFVEQGAVLIDADQIVRDLQKPGEKVFEEMLSKWGPDILTSEGELDRQLVANIVFSNPDYFFKYRMGILSLNHYSDSLVWLIAYNYTC